MIIQNQTNSIPVNIQVFDFENIQDEIEFFTGKYSELFGRVNVVSFSLTEFSGVNLDSNSLGIALAGNKNPCIMSIFVCGIRPDSVAARDGRIQVGDQILEVNGHVLHGRSHLNAGPIIRNEFSNIIQCQGLACSLKLVILRNDDYKMEMAAQLSYTSPMKRELSSRKSTEIQNPPKRKSICKSKSNVHYQTENDRVPHEMSYSVCLLRGRSGFGFAIMEGSFTDEPGIYIKQIVPEGSAAHEGTLRPGDKILRVNRHDAENANYETVLGWIKSSKFELRLLVSRWQFHKENFLQDLQGSLTLRKKRMSAPTLFQKLQTSIQNTDYGSEKCKRKTQQENESSISPNESSQQSNTLLSVPKLFFAQFRRASSPDFNNVPVFKKMDSKTICSTGCSCQDDLMMSRTKSNQDTDSMLTHSILPEEVTEIQIPILADETLGATFINCHDGTTNKLIVDEIFERGLLYEDGRICSGDIILGINGADLNGLSEDESQTIILQSLLNSTNNQTNKKSSLILTVYRSKNAFKPYDKEFNFDIIKKPGKILGLELGTPKYRLFDQETGTMQHIYGEVEICNILKNFLSSELFNGNFEIGDKILEIDGCDVRGFTQEEIAYFFYNCGNRVNFKIGRLTNRKKRMALCSPLNMI